MIKYEPENIFFNKPVLDLHENILLSYPANNTQGKRAVGGKLFVTSNRLIFIPNRIDAFFRGKSWATNIHNVVDVGYDKPDFSIMNIFSGAWRDRLKISLVDEKPQFFVVNNLISVINKLIDITKLKAEHYP